MTSIEDKIRSYGQQRDIEALQKYITSIDTDELVTLVESKFNNANFCNTWNYLLQGFDEDVLSHNKRFRIVEKVLKALESNVVTSSHCNAIIHRLCMDLITFKTEHLVKLCNFCLDCVQNQAQSQMSWGELLPEALNVVIERDKVEHNGVEITGLEFKHQIVEALCLLQWSPNIAIRMTSMFIDMPLTKDEHFQVVNKLGDYLEKLTPQEVPAFVYQLLRLCKNQNSRSIFLKLQYYFTARVYSNLNVNLTETNSENSDSDAIESAVMVEAIEAESTVLYHIHNAASLGHDCIKDYLASFTKLLRSPEFILNPFQVEVLLTISTISYYEEKVFEILRSAISKTYHEELKKTNSAWFREMVQTTPKIYEIFAQVINLSAENRELLLQGLVNFSFILLGVGSALGRDLIAERQWQLGSLILFKIIKRKRHTAPSIIQQLSNCIITGSSINQYVETLYLMSTNLSLLMIENKSNVINLIEGLVQMPGNNANLLLDAIIPLTRVSPTIRDHFILLLRKALYSRSTETRQMAVNGFLKLLSNLKISNAAAISQCTISCSFSSGHSLFTQISMNRASQCTPSVFSNEALCLEILSILRRCFVQQPEIRAKLYDGLYDAVCLNPELAIAVLEMLLMQLSEFYKVDEDELPPIKFEKITLTRDINVTQQEPIGKLIYVLGLVTTLAQSSDEENSTVQKATKIIDSLCSRIIKCELVHFELDDGTDLLDIMPESQHKLIVLKEAMLVYEALIGYKIFMWKSCSENVATQVMSLFQGYQRLLQFSKNLTKAKGKKKNDDSTTTQQPNNTTVNKKDGSKTGKVVFKLPETILDFRVMNKIMSLLHEQIVPWTSNSESSIIKTKREFHRFMMQNFFNLLTLIKNKKFIETQSAKITYSFITEISILLYERIIKRLTEFIDFDSTTAVLALECFHLILNIIWNQFKANFASFLCKVGERDKEEDLASILFEFIKQYEKIFDVEEEEVSEDAEINKLSLVVVNTLSFLSNQIPTNNNSASLQLTEWLKNFAANKKTSNRALCSSFTDLLLDMHIKFKLGLNLFESLSVWIGNVTGVINDEERSEEEFNIVNDLTVNSAFLSVSGRIKSCLEDVEWIINRLKAESYTLTYPGGTNNERRIEKLHSKEKGVCCQLIFLVNILANLSNCTVPPGNLSEAVLKNLSLLYCTLGSFTKYFILRSSKNNPAFQTARFERLVKLVGKQLSPVVYKLILYLEESQKQEAQTSQSKSKKKADTSTLKSKVLKETRLIPKVVYEIEQFSKFVIQLSNKTKVDLSKFVGQGTVRDFRILGLKEVLEKVNTGATQETDVSSVAEDNSVQNIDSEDEGDEATPPPTKKSKH